MFLSRLPTRSPLIRNFNAPTGQKLFIYRLAAGPQTLEPLARSTVRVLAVSVDS